MPDRAIWSRHTARHIYADMRNGLLGIVRDPAGVFRSLLMALHFFNFMSAFVHLGRAMSKR